MSYRSGRTDDPNAEGSGIYNASVMSDSAEDLRAVIERQEGNSDRLENVRSCCDGKLPGTANFHSIYQRLY